MDLFCASAYACGVAGAGSTHVGVFFRPLSLRLALYTCPSPPRYSIPIFFSPFTSPISYVVFGYGIVLWWLVLSLYWLCSLFYPLPPTASSHLFFCLLFDSHEIPFVLCMCLRLAFFALR